MSKTDFNCSNVGLNTVILTVTDGCGNSASKDAVVTVNVPTTTVALVSAPSVRYMDEVTLYAEVESNCGVTSLAGNVDFYLCGVLVGSAPAYPIPVGETGNPNKLRATLLHKVTNDPNTCVVEAVFKSSTPYYLDSPKASTNLIIKQREATYAATGTGNPGNFFCGQSFYWTPTETSNSANVLLNATIVDANTPTGDVRGARVTFYYVNGGVYTPIPSATNLPVNLVNLLDGTVGTVSKSVVLSISGNANSESFTIAVGVSGAYFNRKEAPTSIALITVSKPVKGGFVCGGGTIVNSANTNGWVRGVVGQSTSFSMDLKFNNTKNTAPQGKINNIIFWSWYKPDGTLDNVMHQYEAKSTSITTFVVGKPTVKDAYFTSKANLVEIVNGQSVGIEGNATLQVEMSDLGASGSGFDKIAITIFRKAGGVWLSTEWNGGKTILRNINTGLIGGNIYVSTAGQAQTARIANPITSKQVKEIPVVESVPFNVIAYPNPAKYQFTLVVEGGSKEKVGVMVYDVLGRTVKRIESTDGQPIQFGEELPTGAYFTIVSQGANQKTVRLIKE